MKIHIDGNKAVFNNETILFEQKIGKYIQLENNDIIFLLDIPNDSNTINNLYCFSSNGEFKWRIEPNEFEIKGEDCWPYVGLSKVAKEYFVVDFYGRRFFFAPENGKIIKRDVVK